MTVLFALIQIIKHGLPSLLLIVLFLLFYLVDTERVISVPAGWGLPPSYRCLGIVKIRVSDTAKTFNSGGFWAIILHTSINPNFFPTTLPKAKSSVGNRESGLEKIVVDMLGPKIKLR